LGLQVSRARRVRGGNCRRSRGSGGVSAVGGDTQGAPTPVSAGLWSRGELARGCYCCNPGPQGSCFGARSPIGWRGRGLQASPGRRCTRVFRFTGGAIPGGPG
ncbi:unnamed protein product, partial [Laminaria digitata]